MKRVLVTGAGGQVGIEVARELAGDFEVVALDRTALDLADASSIVRCMREARPAVIVNAGAYTAVDRAEAEREAAHAVNAVAPGVLAEEAKRLGALLVHYSTDYVFDGTKDGAYVEDDAPHPVNAYGRSKLEGERAVAAAGCEHAILRTSWVYGPRGKNFMFTMLRLARERDELRIVDDQRGAPTSSLQLARLTRALAERRAAPGLLHATAAGETTWRRYAEEIFAQAARRDRAFRVPRVVPITTAEFPTPAKRPANSVLSNARLQSTLGLRLEDWPTALAEVLSAAA